MSLPKSLLIVRTARPTLPKTFSDANLDPGKAALLKAFATQNASRPHLYQAFGSQTALRSEKSLPTAVLKVVPARCAGAPTPVPPAPRVTPPEAATLEARRPPIPTPLPQTAKPRRHEPIYSAVGVVEQIGDGFFIAANRPSAPHPFVRLDSAAGKRYHGQCVMADLAEPDRADLPVRSITALPPADALRTRIFAIAADCGVRFGFASAIEQEIAAIKQVPPPRGEDFTHIPFVTIDNPSTQVMDQALAIERIPGGFILRYAIADAQWLVPLGGALCREASQRVASVYLPCDPMPHLGEAASVLPRSLAVEMGSLAAGEERRALVLTVQIGDDGTIKEPTFVHGTLRSRAKLGFAEVQHYHDQPHESCLANKDYSPSLTYLRYLGAVLESRAAGRGMIEASGDALSLRVRSGSDNEVELTRRPRPPVETWNAHLSMLANELAGEALAAAGFGLYRVQAPPSAAQVERMRRELRELGLPWPADVSMQDYKKNLPSDDRRSEVARHILTRCNQPAGYSTEPRGHYSLGLDHYSQWTAPLRRYPDVLVHHLLAALCTPMRRPSAPDVDRHHVVEALRFAAAFKPRERHVMHCAEALLTAAALGPHVQRVLLGIVLERRKNAVLVKLNELPVCLWAAAPHPLPSPAAAVALCVTHADMESGHVTAHLVSAELLRHAA